MQQHAIPQQISSYKFKLVGDMTLGQFGKAAGGIVLAMILNSVKIVFFIKYPLMLVCGGGGLLLAFVPFEDRPLEVWLKAFLKSIYSPTIYVWKKKAEKNWLDLGENQAIDKETEKGQSTEYEISKDEEKRARDYFGSLKIGFGTNAIDEAEDTEDMAVLESMKKISEEMDGGQAIKNDEVQTKVETDSTITKTSKTETDEEMDEKNKEISMGDIKTLKKEKLEATGVVKFGGVPMPVAPIEPNILSGMVTGDMGQIVEEAIVEVQDSHGNPVRVFKTNSLGQFKTPTPLANGKYLVITEKDKFQFDRVEVELVGKILQPIKIQAIG